MTWRCRLIGHRWVHVALYAPKAYVCKRCGEPGFRIAA